MNAKTQEKFFQAVKKHFPNWELKRVSGYVHGVLHGFKRSEPKQVYLRGFKKNKRYATGYIEGLVDAHGADAIFADWAKDLFPCTNPEEVFVFNGRWWEHAS